MRGLVLLEVLGDPVIRFPLAVGFRPDWSDVGAGGADLLAGGLDQGNRFSARGRAGSTAVESTGSIATSLRRAC